MSSMYTFLVGSDYDDYFEVLPIESGRSQNLFWSGVLELVGMVSCMCSSGANVVSSANTSSSAIFNGIGNIYWCGTTNSSSNGENDSETSHSPEFQVCMGQLLFIIIHLYTRDSNAFISSIFKCNVDLFTMIDISV